jgi:hypothetical protein
MDRRDRLPERLHCARQTLGERLLREFQQQAARRAARRRDLLQPGRGPGTDRGLAAPIQRRTPHSSINYRPPAPESFIPRSGGIVPWAPAPARSESARSPYPNRGVRNRQALTSKLDHPAWARHAVVVGSSLVSGVFARPRHPIPSAERCGISRGAMGEAVVSLPNR